MYLRPEARQTVQDFPQLLDYFALVEDGIAWLRSGCFLAAWEIRGEDMEAATIAENFATANRFANGLDLGADFGVGCDLIRQSCTEYLDTPESAWPDPVSRLLEAERRELFRTPGAYWKNQYYFYLTYRPVRNRRAKAQRWFFEDQTSGQQGEGAAQRALGKFQRAVDLVDSLQRANCASVRRLRCYEHDGEVYDELHRYIRRCVFEQDDPFPLPEDASYLHQLFAEDFLGGYQPKLGERYLATVALDGFPRKGYAGIFQGLHSLPFSYRFSQQAEILDTQQAMDFHEKHAKEWSAKKVNFFRKNLFKDASIVDSHAADLEAESDRAKRDAEYKRTIDVFYTSKIVLSDTDATILHEKVREVQEAVRPFQSRWETRNATAAFISSLPGHMHRDVRQNNITTQNLAHFLPLGAPFTGLRYNPSPLFPPNSPALFQGVTASGTPYHYQAHTAREVGHTLFAGPTRAGKTTFISLGIAQWFRYPHAQVFAFDKKKTLYTLTHALGGDFYDLGATGARQIQLCPLASIDHTAERLQCAHWLAQVCELNGLPMTARKRNAIQEGLGILRYSTSRSLTDFQAAVLDDEIKEALQYYISQGLLDGHVDHLRLSRLSVFEMDDLYRGDPRLMNAVMLDIFRRIHMRLRPSVPTLLSIDEFRRALQQEVMVKAMDDLFNEGGKLNVALWVALQDLEAAQRSALGATILQQCMTKVFLPNPMAIQDSTKLAYTACGLNEEDIQTIASAQPRREYYITNREGRRNVSLELGNVALALFSSTDEDRAMVDALIARNPQGWQADWLRHKGIRQNWPEFLEELLTKQLVTEKQEEEVYA